MKTIIKDDCDRAYEEQRDMDLVDEIQLKDRKKAIQVKLGGRFVEVGRFGSTGTTDK